jgi:PAS domain S-box-containing protein
MREVTTLKLENEMDLVLAHKRAMKFCELTGLSLILQTSIATAVSEIARCAIEHGENSEFTLGIDSEGKRKILFAEIHDTRDLGKDCVEALEFARRLIGDIEVERTTRQFRIILRHTLSFGGTISESKIQSFIEYFKKEPPISAYDEIRRKNLQLQTLSERLQESENNFRTLTDTLPLMMFSVNNRGMITFSNRWLRDFLGAAPRELNGTSWQAFIHPDDLRNFTKDIDGLLIQKSSVQGHYRFRHATTHQYLWHLVSILPVSLEKEANGWNGFIVDINAQKKAEQTLKDNKELKEVQQKLYRNQTDLEQKILELNRSNYELEQFAHLATHDLQEPLRKIFFYSDILKRKFPALLDQQVHGLINNMTLAAGRMKELINDLLTYSQLQQQQLAFEKIDLSETFSEILQDMDFAIREKSAVITIGELPVITANRMRLRQLFTNLMANSLKYSRKDVRPEVEISSTISDGKVTVTIRDNGIGFDESFNEKIFGLFERLHTRDEYPGTGIGLSICKRIAELHNGSITANSRPGEFAIFVVNLPLEQNIEQKTEQKTLSQN